jgi:hypothetical protein
MPYLLADWGAWPENIILAEVAKDIQAEQILRNGLRERFPLHKYIHHGLSSQAMLFNLVWPLVLQKDLSPLAHAFKQNGLTWPFEAASAKFEVENRSIFNEDSGQPTSIDLVIAGQDHRQSLFIESKLVEREFGGCSVFDNGDCDGRNPAHQFQRCYLHHLGRHYWPLMEKHGFLAGPAGASPICPLAIYYQFFREVLFALESGGDFVLMYDRRNPAFYCGSPEDQRGLMPFLITFVPEKIRSRIHSISIQQIVAAYKETVTADWLKEFEIKYAMI